ncbi:MAG: PAS domain S-box protein, partial [Planctomycetota bacterium]
LRDYEARLRCKDGTIKHVLIDSNVLWEDGEFIHTRCFTRDLSQRRLAQASLLENEKRLALALEAGRMGNWEWHIPQGTVRWSSALEQIHGLPPGGFAGTFAAYQEDIHPEDRSRVLETIRQTVELRQEHHLEYRIVWPDGSVHWLEAWGTLFCDDAGQPERVIGVCADVSERKQLEELLRRQLDELAEAETRVRSVVDNVIDGIITIDDQGLVDTFNPAAESIFGYPSSEIIGQNIRVLMPEPYHSDHDGYVASYLRSGEAKVIGIGREVTGKRKDGSTFPLDLAVSESQHGQRRFFTGIVRDITERKRTEQSLRFLAEASQSLSALEDYKSTLQRVAQLAVPHFADWCAVDMMTSGGAIERMTLAHIDPEKLLVANELAERYPTDPHVTHGAMEVLRTGKSEFVSVIDDSMLREAAQDDEHLRILREMNLQSYMCVPLKTKQKTLGVISFVSSESGRVYRAKDLALAEDLASRAAIAIDNAQLYQQVREADRRKDEFLSMLAHELRNPLAPIRSGLDLLALDAAADPATVKMMQEQVNHMVRLVDDLLDVSRIMRGRIDLRREPVELATLVGRSVDALRPQIESQSQELVVSLPSQPIWLHADPVRLIQVIENLLNNASKYTDSKGRIELTASCEQEQAVIIVKDTGIGIESDLLPKVFELFTQSSRSLDRSQGGLGIGLTLVQNLVQTHGGTVTAHSDGLGQGSTFEVRLPLMDQAPAQKESSVVAPEMVQNRRIVVVDDNVSAAWLLSKLLTKLGNHEVITAHDGHSALETIRASHPEIVLLDIGLPGMDGYEVGRNIRESSAFDDVLLVALTGYGQPEDRRRSKEAGFDEHLVKPPSLDQLSAVLAHPKLTAK